jgi:endonuclease/exonuclease/phosphatase family metal-dependent hydrolase
MLPNADREWTQDRYNHKLSSVARVVADLANEGDFPSLLALAEVENKTVLEDLVAQEAIKHLRYEYVHYDSSDERGIDVALLYDSTKVKILNSKTLCVPLENDVTRDILYVKALIEGKDTLHAMVCHLPSQLGGSATTSKKRQIAKQVIQNEINTILHVQPKANVIVMGDMNSEAIDDLQGMNNLMIDLEKAGIGTHKYQGMWSCLDQFYVSSALKNTTRASVFSPEWLLEEDTKYLDYQPKRTYVGYRYHDGYSDHLPVVLKIKSSYIK